MANENVNDEKLELHTADFGNLIMNGLSKQFEETSTANLFYMSLFITNTLAGRGWNYDMQCYILDDFVENGLGKVLELMENNNDEN